EEVMQAVVVHETGGPEVLVLEEADRPEPGDGEVLVRVRAASVNPVDWKYRRGIAPKELPAVLGNDISGTIESSRADGFAEGDEVFGWAASGGDAEVATADAAGAARKPDTVGGETTQSLVPPVREGGIVVTIANAPPEEAARERGARAELLVTSPNADQLARIAELMTAGDLQVEIAEVLPLSEVRRAHEL